VNALRDVSGQPVVNFTNILQAAFAPIFFGQKLKSQTVIREKLPKILLYKRDACKMFVKLTPVLSQVVRSDRERPTVTVGHNKRFL